MRYMIVLALLTLLHPLKAACEVGASTTERGSWGVFLRADALGWQAAQDGTGYATKRNTTGGLFGPTYYPDFSFHGAFRVGGGYISCCNDWVWEGYWTHYDQLRTSTLLNQESFYWSYFNPMTVNNNLTIEEISSQLHLYFNLIDFTLSRSFIGASCFSWTPYVGVRGMIIKESDKFIDIDNQPITSSWTVTERFSGAGLRGGLGLAWLFAKCMGQWSLIGDSSISIIQGTARTSIKGNYVTGTTPDATKSHFYRVAARSVLQLSAGLRWEKTFCCYPTMLDLVYETLYVPSVLNTGFNGQPIAGTADLSFSGVTLSARVGF